MLSEAPEIEPSHILVVEDNLSQRETLCDILEFEGFEILACGTAAEASELIDHNDLSVAILDLRLPDHPGTEILKRLREHDEKIQVILYTAYGSFDSARDSVNLGAFAYLEKTTQPEELVRQVHRASRKWMSQTLRETEKRYRILAELSPVGIFHTDPSGGYLYVNRRWCEITGLTLEQALVGGWQEGVAAEDRDRIAAKWEEAVAARDEFFAEYRCRRGDGETAWVYAQARADIEDGNGVTGYVGTITDISQRKSAEESLRLLEAALDQALLSVAVITADPDPRFVWANPAFSSLTGYSREELLGESPDILNSVKTHREILDQRSACLRRDKSFVGDLVNYRKDGSTFVAEWRLDPIRDAEGGVMHWVAILR